MTSLILMLFLVDGTAWLANVSHVAGVLRRRHVDDALLVLLSSVTLSAINASVNFVAVGRDHRSAWTTWLLK